MRCRGFVSIWFPQLREKGDGPPQDSGVMRIKDNKQRDLPGEKYHVVRKTMAQISAEWEKKGKKGKKEKEKDLCTQFCSLAAICGTNWTVKPQLLTAEKDTYYLKHLQQKEKFPSQFSFLNFAFSNIEG